MTAPPHWPVLPCVRPPMRVAGVVPAGGELARFGTEVPVPSNRYQSNSGLGPMDVQPVPVVRPSPRKPGEQLHEYEPAGVFVHTPPAAGRTQLLVPAVHSSTSV